jgi:hypothetical protein
MAMNVNCLALHKINNVTFGRVYFISKSTLVLLVTILNVYIDDEIILPLYFLFTLIILIINKYSISLINMQISKKS